ncbi:MAG: Flp family type IVb pilin [Acidobacteriota bacterium]
MRKLWKNEKGQDLLEYALVAGFVATAATSVAPAIVATAAHLGQSIGLLQAALAVTGN